MRFVVLVALVVCASIPAFAQVAKMPLVGVLRINTLATNEPGASMLRKALAAVGRVDNHNLRLEFRLAEGDPERYPALAERLVQDGASVIIAYGTPPVRAAQQATTAIPIVAVAYDLVESRIHHQPGQARWQHHRGQHPLPRARYQETRHPERDRADGTTLWRIDGARSQIT